MTPDLTLWQRVGLQTCYWDGTQKLINSGTCIVERKERIVMVNGEGRDKGLGKWAFGNG